MNRGHRLLLGVVLVGVALVAALLGPASAATAAPPAGVPESTAQASAGPAFGPILDWSADSALRYARRLGGTPQLYGESIGYPLTAADRTELDTAAQAAAAQGSTVLLQLEPRKPLASLTRAQADDLARSLGNLYSRGRTRFLVDFAPEMNGSWTAWGQQPASYVAAFRTVAAAVHAGDSHASTVWEPANGAGYPFGGSRGEVTPSGPRVISQLDTDGDGRVTERDDPYGVYWPGGAYVDQVGLSVYWFGGTDRLGANTLPPANWYRNSLTGAAGYSTPTGAGRNFVARFAVGQGKHMLVETGALTVASEPAGASPSAIADDWIRQVLDPATLSNFPSITTIAWFEQRRAEAEAAGRTVDWRVTATPDTRRTLRASLTADGIALGPVPTSGGRGQANAATAQVYDTSGAGGQGDRILGGIGVLTALFFIAGLARRFRPAWRYPPGDDPDRGARSSRDGRIDLLRGFVMSAVVVTHIGLAGPWSWFVERAGALTGAEMFVLLSGVVLAAVYSRMASRHGAYEAAVQMGRRAARLYAATVGVILLVFFLAKIPGLDATAVTTFTDRGTGTGGEQAAGRVYYVFGTSQHLLDYPPPGYAIKDLLLLRYGPWPMNIMGLFVILSLAVPACMWLVRRGLWWLLLLLSWGLFAVNAVNAVHHIQLFDAQFEPVFPLLAWQVAFTHGLVIGRYRIRIVAALSSTAGKTAIAVGLGGYLAGLLVLRSGTRIPGVPAYSDLYESWYLRTNLDGGRLVDLAISAITIYAFLTACWRPMHATLGRFFEPLGRASLTVFFLQVFLVLAIGNIPHLDEHSAWQGFTVQTVALALVWLAVRPWRRGGNPVSVDVPREPEVRRILVSSGRR